MQGAPLFHLSIIILLVLVYSSQVFAGWTRNGAQICYQNDIQRRPRVLSDGAKGAYIVWYDARLLMNVDIYAQRVDSLGRIQWIKDGVRVTGAAQDQEFPQIVSDGTGGAIAAWVDERNGHWDIYAQRMDPDGNMLWAPDGIPVCTMAEDQENFQMIADGEGGAIIVWEDDRNYSVNGARVDLYAQKISSSGAMLWAVGGRAVCTDTLDQSDVQLISDGEGGAIFTWDDYRDYAPLAIDSSRQDIYAARIRTSGSYAWTDVPICLSNMSQWYCEIVPDGNNGAIILWRDDRFYPYYNLYAQRVDSTGAQLWAIDGIEVGSIPESEFRVEAISDETGGAIMVWADDRGVDLDLYSQRINSDGTPLWAAEGVPVCTEPTHQVEHEIIQDGMGGVIITWEDSRSGSGTDIFTQRLDSNGNVLWTPGGVAVCDTVGSQDYPSLASNGSGGAIIAWSDQRHSSYEDIYAHMVTGGGGFVATELQSYSAHTENGSIYIYWTLSDVGIKMQFFVLRAEAPEWTFREIDEPFITQEYYSYCFIDKACNSGRLYRYRIEVSDEKGRRLLFETDPVRTPAMPLTLYQNRPNPFSPFTKIDYYLPEAGRVKIEIFDISGRRVARLINEMQSEGPHTVTWDGLGSNGNPVSSGIYFYRLDTGKRKISRKMIRIR